MTERDVLFLLNAIGWGAAVVFWSEWLVMRSQYRDLRDFIIRQHDRERPQ